MKRYAVFIGFIVIASLLGWGVWKSMDDPQFARTIPSQLIGKPAPEFALPDLLDPNQTVSLEQMKGKVWLFNVWGSWCPECWREHPYLERLAKNEGVLIVGLNWRDEKPDAINMLRKSGNPYQAIAYDYDSDVAIDWGVYGAPETFLVDREGIVRAKQVGSITSAVWQGEFGSLYRQLNETN